MFVLKAEKSLVFWRRFFAGCGLLFLAGGLHGQDGALSESDRQALLKRLEDLQNGAGGRAEERASIALSVFKAAAQSEAKAHELYMKCVEKVRFQDEKKTGSQFRDWKRRHRERNDDPAFRRQLCYQLLWLVLCIEVEGGLETSEANARAVKVVEQILADTELDGGVLRGLEDDVTNSVFSSAYQVNLETKFPRSPMKLESLYRESVIPNLVTNGNPADLREAWAKWILHEGLLIEARAGDSPRGERSSGLEKFLLERRPQMLWELELEVYKMGNEKEAALAMVKHLEANVGHANERDWTEEFIGLLNRATEE